MRLGVWCFFCFKQKTAYEMRISDWSSGVCASDLPDSLLHGRLENGRGYRIAKKTYQVKIRNIYPGGMQQDWPHRTNGIGAYVSNPTIVFVGAGGYWAEVDLNEFPEPIAKLIAGDVDSYRPRTEE